MSKNYLKTIENFLRSPYYLIILERLKILFIFYYLFNFQSKLFLRGLIQVLVRVSAVL